MSLDKAGQELIAAITNLLPGARGSLVGADLQGADLAAKDLHGEDLSSADLTGANLRGANLSGATLRDTDLRADVSRIQAKTLVLCGIEDLPTPPELARELAGSIPNARLEMIEQAAHLPCIEQPAAMAARIQGFFQENGYDG